MTPHPNMSRARLSPEDYARVLAKTKRRCAYCGATCVSKDKYRQTRPHDRKPLSIGTIDHIEPVSQGGTDDLDNLVCACLSCNSAKGSTPWWVFCSQPRYSHCFPKRKKGLTTAEPPAKLEGPGQSRPGFPPTTEPKVTTNQTSLFPTDDERNNPDGDGAPIYLYKITFAGSEPTEPFGTDMDGAMKRLYDLIHGDLKGTTSTPTMQRYAIDENGDEPVGEDMLDDAIEAEPTEESEAFDADRGPFTGYRFHGDERDWTQRDDEPSMRDCWSQGGTPMCVATWDGRDVYLWMPDGSQEILDDKTEQVDAFEATFHELVKYGAVCDLGGPYSGCTLVSWDGNELTVSDGDSAWTAARLMHRVLGGGLAWYNYAQDEIKRSEPDEWDGTADGLASCVKTEFVKLGGTIVDTSTVAAPTTDVRVTAPTELTEAQETEARAMAAKGKAQRTTTAGVVSEIAAARIEDADTRLRKIGLVRPSRNVTSADGYRVDTVTEGGYVPGTAALDEAYDRLATSRRLWEERPPIEESLQLVIDAVLSEERQDITVNTGELRMLEDGRLCIPGFQASGLDDTFGLGMEIRGFEQLLPKTHGLAMIGKTLRKKAEGYAPVFPEAMNFLLSMPSDERAWVMNRCFQRSDSRLKLRTRLGRDGARQLFAVVSPTYAVFDADKVAELLRTTLGGKGLRGEVAYEAGTTNLTVDASYHASADIQDFAAGDVFQVGYRSTSNDTGRGSIRIGGSADWNACLNFIILSHDDAELVARVHKGKVAEVAAEVRAGVEKIEPVFEHFARQWGVLVNEPIYAHEVWGQTFTTVEEALTYGVKHGKLDMEMEKEVALEVLLEADKLGANQGTLAAVIDAVTRAAHMRLIEDCARDRIERMAGALVPVLVGQA